MERERSIFSRGHRYTLRAQDATCLAAYESVRKGREEGIMGIRGYKHSPSSVLASEVDIEAFI